MTDYDSPWKEALDVYFEPFVAFCFPHAHRNINWSKGYESLDKELQQIVPESEQGRRVVDKLVKVWRRDGDEAWVLVHVEVQNQQDADLPRRMYVYNYRLFDRYNRQVASLAVLGDERASWRPSRFGYDLWGCSVGIEFPVVKLLDYASAWPALEADTNPFATVVMAHLKTLETRQDPRQRRVWKWQLVRGLYERGMAAKDVRQLFRFIDWLMDLPKDLEVGFRQELANFEQERTMPFITSIERLGRQEELLKGIAACLEIKFGEEGLKLMPEIERDASFDQLPVILDSIKTASTADDLRRIWSQPGSGTDANTSGSKD